MSAGPSIIRKHATGKSNSELVNSLRANIEAAQQGGAESLRLRGLDVNGTQGSSAASSNSTSASISSWTTKKDGVLFVPSMDSTATGLAEERSQYDITVKLFFLPSTRFGASSALTEDAVALVLKELGVDSIDLLIVSYPGISFDADDEDDDEDFEHRGLDIESSEETMTIWRTLEALYSRGIIKKLGLAEFSSSRLKRFLSKVKIRPAVDQISLRDCCVVPKSLILYARKEKIELLTHSDCTNILPTGTIRDLLGGDVQETRLLIEEDLMGEIQPQWVIKYTAVVEDRGVIEKKGYFCLAETAGS